MEKKRDQNQQMGAEKAPPVGGACHLHVAQMYPRAAKRWKWQTPTAPDPGPITEVVPPKVPLEHGTRSLSANGLNDLLGVGLSFQVFSAFDKARRTASDKRSSRPSPNADWPCFEHIWFICGLLFTAARLALGRGGRLPASVPPHSLLCSLNSSSLLQQSKLTEPKHWPLTCSKMTVSVWWDRR